MKITIESPHFKLSPELSDYINAKVNKLGHINERLILTEVTLKLGKSSTDENKICEIKVFGPQIELFAKQSSMTFEDAITETAHALSKQLRTQKTKREKTRDKMQVDDVEENEAID